MAFWRFYIINKNFKRLREKSSNRPSCDCRVQTGTQQQGCNYHFYRGCVSVCCDQTVFCLLARQAIALLKDNLPTRCEKLSTETR